MSDNLHWTNRFTDLIDVVIGRLCWCSTSIPWHWLSPLAKLLLDALHVCMDFSLQDVSLIVMAIELLSAPLCVINEVIL